MIQVAIADDHQLVRDGLKLYLSKVPHIDLKFEVSNGIELINQLSSTSVDIVILDLNMPVLDGRKTLERIQRLYGAKVKVIMLSFNNSLHFIKKYMKLGASAFLGKSSAVPFLIDAIETVHAGKLYFEPHVPATLIQELHLHKEVDYKALPGEMLSPREIEVLVSLCEGLSCPQIAVKLFISSRTVENHKANIFTKFEVNNLPQMMVKAILLGYYDLPL